MPRKPAAKKTGARKAPSKKAPAAPKVDESTLDEDYQKALDLVTIVNATIIEHTPGKGKIGATAIHAAAHLSALASDIKKALDGLKALADEHQKAGGLFETTGPFILELKHTERKNTSWKDEAIARAKALAEAKGETFNEKAYLAKVAAATEPKPSVSMGFQRKAPLED